MPLELFRVDDRLVHGQVVIGWGRHLSAEVIILVDDDVAGSSWEQDLYRMAVPVGIELIFASVGEAESRLVEWHADPRVGILLTGSIEAMVRLNHAAPDVVNPINLGGIHHSAERREKLRYIYLTDAEEIILRQLHTNGVQVTAQDLPTTPPVDVVSML